MAIHYSNTIGDFYDLFYSDTIDTYRKTNNQYCWAPDFSFKYYEDYINMTYIDINNVDCFAQIGVLFPDEFHGINYTIYNDFSIHMLNYQSTITYNIEPLPNITQTNLLKQNTTNSSLFYFEVSITSNQTDLGCITQTPLTLDTNALMSWAHNFTDPQYNITCVYTLSPQLEYLINFQLFAYHMDLTACDVNSLYDNSTAMDSINQPYITTNPVNNIQGYRFEPQMYIYSRITDPNGTYNQDFFNSYFYKTNLYWPWASVLFTYGTNNSDYGTIYDKWNNQEFIWNIYGKISVVSCESSCHICNDFIYSETSSVYTNKCLQCRHNFVLDYYGSCTCIKDSYYNYLDAIQDQEIDFHSLITSGARQLVRIIPQCYNSVEVVMNTYSDCLNIWNKKIRPDTSHLEIVSIEDTVDGFLVTINQIGKNIPSSDIRADCINKLKVSVYESMSFSSQINSIPLEIVQYQSSEVLGDNYQFTVFISDTSNLFFVDYDYNIYSYVKIYLKISIDVVQPILPTPSSSQTELRQLVAEKILLAFAKFEFLTQSKILLPNFNFDMSIDLVTIIDSTSDYCSGCQQDLQNINHGDIVSTYMINSDIELTTNQAQICWDPKCKSHKETYRVAMTDIIYVQFTSLAYQTWYSKLRPKKVQCYKYSSNIRNYTIPLTEEVCNITEVTLGYNIPGYVAEINFNNQIFEYGGFGFQLDLSYTDNVYFDKNITFWFNTYQLKPAQSATQQLKKKEKIIQVLHILIPTLTSFILLLVCAFSVRQIVQKCNN